MSEPCLPLCQVGVSPQGPVRLLIRPETTVSDVVISWRRSAIADFDGGHAFAGRIFLPLSLTQPSLITCRAIA